MAERWSVCCLRRLPMVQDYTKPHGEYVKAMSPLFDTMTEYTAHEISVIKTRFIPMIDATERDAKRAEWWDTRMFLIGFFASLVVTIAAAINIASFIDGSTRDAIGATVLGISSIGTAALGLRERLKFQEVAIIARKMSNKLQRRGFLFLSRSEPYDSEDRMAAYKTFITHTEKIKLQADEDHMKLQLEKDDGGKAITHTQKDDDIGALPATFSSDGVESPRGKTPPQGFGKAPPRRLRQLSVTQY